MLKHKPILVLDLDHTLFHTTTPFESHLRPHYAEFLTKMQKIYVLVAFTMGSRAYGHDRCQKLGLTKWIPHSNIFGREDTQEDASGHRKKSFAYLSLCKDCQKHCVAVDDHPQWWLEPTFSWHHNPHTKKFKGRGFVLKICPFSFDKNSPEKNDTCLLGLGQLLEANVGLVA